jgi:hypothetical protein
VALNTINQSSIFTAVNRGLQKNHDTCFSSGVNQMGIFKKLKRLNIKTFEFQPYIPPSHICY